MTMPTDSNSRRAAAADTQQGAVLHDEMDPSAENRMRRLYAWAWRAVLIACVIVLVSPPAQARHAAHAPDCALCFSAR